MKNSPSTSANACPLDTATWNANQTEEEQELLDGLSATELFSRDFGTMGMTFNDLIILPQHIHFGVDKVDLSSHFTKNIRLHSPMIASPMNTVTQAPMAIAMALEGGIGIIHHACSIEEQAEMVCVWIYDSILESGILSFLKLFSIISRSKP